MTKNNKGRNGGDRPTQKTTSSRRNTAIDPLSGWFSLAKSSRIKRQQKWQKGGRR